MVNSPTFIKVFAGNIFDLGAAASIARFERGSGSGSFIATVAELEGESYECYMSNGFCHHGFKIVLIQGACQVYVSYQNLFLLRSIGNRSIAQYYS